MAIQGEVTGRSVNLAGPQSLRERLRAETGDPSIRILALPGRRQIMCRAEDEAVVRALVTRYAPGELIEIVAL